MSSELAELAGGCRLDDHNPNQGPAAVRAVLWRVEHGHLTRAEAHQVLEDLELLAVAAEMASAHRGVTGTPTPPGKSAHGATRGSNDTDVIHGVNA